MVIVGRCMIPMAHFDGLGCLAESCRVVNMLGGFACTPTRVSLHRNKNDSHTLVLFLLTLPYSVLILICVAMLVKSHDGGGSMFHPSCFPGPPVGVRIDEVKKERPDSSGALIVTQLALN